jgi:chromosome segregation ATPase
MDPEIAQQFALVHRRLDDHDANFARIDQRFEQIDQRFEQIDQRFEKIDQRFEKIDQRFEKIDQRFEKIDQRFEKIDQRFEKIDQRFEAIDDRFDNLVDEVTRNVIGHMEMLFESLRSDIRVFAEGLKGQGIKLEEHEKRITKLEKRKSA